LSVDGCHPFHHDDIPLYGVLREDDVSDPDSFPSKSIRIDQDMIRRLQSRGHAGPFNTIPASASKRPHDQIERLLL
jgi:hypothetical protein